MLKKKKKAEGISQITNFSMRIFYFIKIGINQKTKNRNKSHALQYNIFYIEIFLCHSRMKNLHISWNREEKYTGINWHSVLKLDLLLLTETVNFILTSVC